MRGAPRRKQTLNCQTEQLRRLAVTITVRSLVLDIVKMTLLRVEYFRGPYRVSKVSDELEVTAGVLGGFPWVLATAWIRVILTRIRGKEFLVKKGTRERKIISEVKKYRSFKRRNIDEP
jgi:hypothetical protein